MNSILRVINNIQELELVGQDTFSTLYETPRYTIIVTHCIDEIQVIDKVTLDVYVFNSECKPIYKTVSAREVIL